MWCGSTYKLILHKFYRFLTYFPFKLALASVWLVTMPFIMMFNWSKIWQLLIAHEENCSVDEARNLMATMPKYKFCRWNICFPNERSSCQQQFNIDSDTEIDTSHITSPSQYYRPENIYHSSVYRD